MSRSCLGALLRTDSLKTVGLPRANSPRCQISVTQLMFAPTGIAHVLDIFGEFTQEWRLETRSFITVMNNKRS